jgi:L-threonylcarbamoyladenylate synthase
VSTRTRSISIATVDDKHTAIEEAAEILRRGGLVAFPTETVYGLGADATNPEAVARIFAAKGRPASNPLIVHTHDVPGARRVVRSWPHDADRLASAFWPGPLSLVLPRSSLIPEIVTAGRDTVGVRVPDHPVALALLRAFDRPIAAPSANRSTGISPTRAEHVRNDLEGRIDLILDAGPTPVGIESTVLDLTTDPPRLLRPGAITVGQIEAVLGRSIEAPRLEAAATEPASSPGQLAVHYAPRTGFMLVEPEQVARPPWPHGGRVGLLVVGRDVPHDAGQPALRIDLPTPERASRDLYATLHRLDASGLDVIYAVPPPDVDAWRAVRDRLWRASRRWAQAGR